MKRQWLLLLLCLGVSPMLSGKDSRPSMTVLLEGGQQILVDNLQLYQSLPPAQRTEALSHLNVLEQGFQNQLKAGTLFPATHAGLTVEVTHSGNNSGAETGKFCCGGGGGGGGGSALTFYGYGSNTFNLTGGPNSSTNVPCINFFGVKICSGAASAWATYYQSAGIIVDSTAAFGIAAADANAWLGASYVSQVPSGYTSSVTVTATVYTEDETGGVSGIGVSCAPLYINESDFSGSHSDTLASCLSSFSVSIPVFDAGAAASAGEKAFTDFLNALNNAGTITGLLGTLPSYKTTTFTWTGNLTHGSSVGIAVNPDTQAADSGAGTEVNVSRSIVQVEVFESW